MSRCFLSQACLGCLFLAAACFAQTAPTATPAGVSLDEALQLARAHRYSDAAKAIRGVSPPRDPGQRIAFFRLRAAIESGLGRANAAAADMEAAAKLAPQNAELQVAAALARLQAQVEAKVDPSATLELLRAASMPPGLQLDARLRTAEILSRANLLEQAAQDLAEASRLAPDRADILFNLALARYGLGLWDTARESAERSKALGDSGSTESLLGDIEEKQGDALAAVRSYQAAVELEPGAEQHRLTLATELLKHQTFDAAIIVLEQAAGLFPSSVRIRVLLGLSYYLVDRSSDSVRTLLDGVKLDTKGTLAVRYLGEITLQDSAFPDPLAVAQICAFADAHPRDKSGNALCGGVLLRIAEESGNDSRKREILRRLREAVQVAPEEALASCQFGKALEWSQQWPQARTQLENCVSLSPDSPEGHYRLARVYRRLGLTARSSEQTNLQQQAAKKESEESNRRANTVTRFLVLLSQ